MPDSTVIVTGAASGIGAGIADELIARGWRVGALDLHPAAGATTFRVVDMGDGRAVAEAVRSIESDLGPITAAVSAAGYYETAAISALTPRQSRRMLDVHLGGLVNLSRAVLPGMVAAGSGSIVAVGSELGVGGGGLGDSHYAAAKGAVHGLVRSLAAEFAPQGVRVNAVAPGPTDTPLLAADSPWREPSYLATLPIGRLASPEEVALCVAFLLDEGSFLVGETLNPNSGAVI